MEKLILNKSNGKQVSCLIEVPRDPAGIVLVVHGFDSSKECATVQMLMRRMPPAGIGVLAIDQPGHGHEESSEEELRVGNCLDSVEAAERYIRETYPGLAIYYFASSFGAYIVGLYLSEREHSGRKAFFRSAAVNMPSLFIKENPTEAERKIMEKLERDGYFYPAVEIDEQLQYSGVKVTKGMMRDLADNDLFEKFAPMGDGPHRIEMAHGGQDQTIDPQAALSFARKFSIPIHVFEEEGHSLSLDPGTPDKVADLAIKLFKE